MTGFAMAAQRAEKAYLLPVSNGEVEDCALTFRPVLNRREAEELIEMDATFAGSNPAWSAFFVENLTEFLVFGERPTGRIREEDVRWLSSCLLKSVSPNTPVLLRALVLQAEDVPASLIQLAMRVGAMRNARHF